MITKEQMEKLGQKFATEYSETLLLKANIAAINQLLIAGGAEQPLYQAIIKSMKEFQKKVSKQ
jgi:hypothetical protein